MKPCYYAKFCGKRMAHGDRADGCSTLDQRTCDPSMPLREETDTAPGQPPYRKCGQCPRTLTQQAWESTRATPVCECGSVRWFPV